tara:strand:- start:300 stop:572 length:273 start_codon:yes stop_codon:yes gene_type:complete
MAAALNVAGSKLPSSVSKVMSTETRPEDGGGGSGSSTSAQFEPANPAKHVQLNAAIPSVQLPPFSHGVAAHSSMSVPQLNPVKPDTHEHA